MADMDPRLLEFLQKKINSFVKWDLVRFFYDNPHTTDTADNIARYAGRSVETIRHELAELSQEQVLEENQLGDMTVYSLASDRQTRELLEQFVQASDDRQFRVKAFLPQTANLVEGAPGTGKTTLGMQFIYYGIAACGEPGLILTFEEFPQQYYRDAASFGWDFYQMEREGKLRVVMSSPEVTKADLEQVGGRIERLVREMDAKRILIDSLSHFERMSEEPARLRGIVYGFVNSLKREGLTAVLTRENMALLGEAEGTDDALAFMVDSYVLLRYVEIESAIRKALLVLKMRGSNHDKGIRQFEVTSRGVEVRAPFEGREGIMSGSPRRMVDSFVQAFVRR
jgi:circadian clock protein KaiC